MITAIREVRRARGLTLDDVARACSPPTTAQTIGRLETGTRTVSVAWLNRIAAALGVTAADLVTLPARADVPVAALLGPAGAVAPTRSATVVAPHPAPGALAITVTAGVGDYRAGDEIWCTRLAPEQFASALNRDVLVPRPAGRFAFGRLIGREGDRVQLLPLGAGARQQIIASPPWIASATRLIRAL
ncbi:Helix-turn-helix domain-containing protein [Sphingomonas guangdongensis]|uniref:Helix-turn-helix domain-containing protein n=1 Tax=Sphingomonas guangdongensis TaxID=1141890 RepID=A0A285QM53_9SPHN|nr:helix-turn-helix transcriptional regulator [Sphingomonas guangdongensis]SOB81172.1 Helix-turn-helix domain-containing protein [Sphingomonas guangdongensis]